VTASDYFWHEVYVQAYERGIAVQWMEVARRHVQSPKRLNDQPFTKEMTNALFHQAPQWRRIKTVDDRFAAINPSTLSVVLAALENDGPFDLDLSGNNLMDLTPLLEFSGALRYLNLTNNRLFPGRDTEEDLMKLLAKVAENDGALIVYDNPVASCSAKFLEPLVSISPELFLRFLWVPRQWLDGAGWQSLLSLSLPELEVLKQHYQDALERLNVAQA